MQGEKLFRGMGLALVLLFPLVSVLQLRDSDGTWRRAASAVRPAVVALYPHAEMRRAASEAGPAEDAVGCGVLVQNRPLRMVATGNTTGRALESRVDGRWVRWETIYTDVEGQFSVLQAADEMRLETAGAGSAGMPVPVIPWDAAAAEAAATHDVQAALVGPRGIAAAPLWVGVLTPGSGPSGRPAYHTALLRPVRDMAALGTSEAWAETEVSLDPILAGAPFVDASGRVVALYLGSESGDAEALPLSVVASALVMLHLQGP